MKNKAVCTHERMMEQEVELHGERNSETFLVRVPGIVCAKCGFVGIANKQSGKFTQAVSDAYRRAHGLLTTADLVRLRKLRRMTQIEFANYLGVGTASVKRWECGQVQDRAMDGLIRLKTDPDLATKNANIVNATRQVLIESAGKVEQVYHSQAKIRVDMSSWETANILNEEPVAA